MNINRVMNFTDSKVRRVAEFFFQKEAKSGCVLPGILLGDIKGRENVSLRNRGELSSTGHR